MSERIRDYWNQRAGENSGSLTATTQDIWLRRLEVASLIGVIEKLHLPPDAHIADMGCGDGHTILQLARQFPEFHFLGFDYAPQMIETAQVELTRAGGLNGRVRFITGDLNDPVASTGTGTLDLAMTGRSLINLETDGAQYAAISRIALCLKLGGVYLAIENFHEGQDAMNTARAAMGLLEIPIRWHNHFFREAEFRKQTAAHFSSVEVQEFSSAYYYATRVIYSAMCHMQGVEPDYDHDIHRLAVHLPPMGNFSPIRLALCRKAG
ncbi:MAG: class I SAM-dependent methyltransferase [Alphaproteobacteria bacterium]|nr:class I SAM-dependent methyltransferase [Alphaproteobacteria bacterium]